MLQIALSLLASVTPPSWQHCIPPAIADKPISQASAAEKEKMVTCLAAVMAKQIQANLPNQIDEVTKLISVMAAGTQFMYRLELDALASEFGEAEKNALRTVTRENVCAVPEMTRGMELGLIYIYTWFDKEGRLIANAIIRDCPPPS